LFDIETIIVVSMVAEVDAASKAVTSPVASLALPTNITLIAIAPAALEVVAAEGATVEAAAVVGAPIASGQISP
jgi:hypothetical protein